MFKDFYDKIVSDADSFIKSTPKSAKTQKALSSISKIGSGVKDIFKTTKKEEEPEDYTSTGAGTNIVSLEPKIKEPKIKKTDRQIEDELIEENEKLQSLDIYSRRRISRKKFIEKRRKEEERVSKFTLEEKLSERFRRDQEIMGRNDVISAPPEPTAEQKALQRKKFNAYLYGKAETNLTEDLNREDSYNVFRLATNKVFRLKLDEKLSDKDKDEAIKQEMTSPRVQRQVKRDMLIQETVNYFREIDQMFTGHMEAFTGNKFTKWDERAEYLSDNVKKGLTMGLSDGNLQHKVKVGGEDVKFEAPPIRIGQFEADVISFVGEVTGSLPTYALLSAGVARGLIGMSSNMARFANTYKNVFRFGVKPIGEEFVEYAVRNMDGQDYSVENMAWGMMGNFVFEGAFGSKINRYLTGDEKKIIMKNTENALPHNASFEDFNRVFKENTMLYLQKIKDPDMMNYMKEQRAIGLKSLEGQKASKFLEDIKDPNFNPIAYMDENIKKREKARIAEKGTLKGRAKDMLMNLKKWAIEMNAPIEDALVANAKEFDYSVRPEFDIHNQIDMVYRANEVAIGFIQDSGVMKAIDSVDNIDHFDDFLIARHHIDLHEKGFNMGRDIEKDKMLVASVGNKYEKQAKMVTEFSHKVLDYSVERKLIHKDLAKMLKEIYPNYVPMDRVFNELEKSGQFFGASGIASLSKQSVVQKLVGSDRAIESPTGSLIDKVMTAHVQGEKNFSSEIIINSKNLPSNPLGIEPLRTKADYDKRISIFSELKESQAIKKDLLQEIRRDKKSISKLKKEVTKIKNEGEKLLNTKARESKSLDLVKEKAARQAKVDNLRGEIKIKTDKLNKNINSAKNSILKNSSYIKAIKDKVLSPILSKAKRIKGKYKEITYTKAELHTIKQSDKWGEELSKVFDEIDVSSKGKEFFKDGEFLYSESSSFPKWIPEYFRDKKLLDKVVQMVIDGKPPSSSYKNQKALYDLIVDRIASKVGGKTEGLVALLKDFEKSSNPKILKLDNNKFKSLKKSAISTNKGLEGVFEKLDYLRNDIKELNIKKKELNDSVKGKTYKDFDSTSVDLNTDDKKMNFLNEFLQDKDFGKLKEKMALRNKKMKPFLDKLEKSKIELDNLNLKRRAKFDEALSLAGTKAGDENTISWLNEGFKEVYKVYPEIARAAKGLNAQQIAPIMRVSANAVRIAKLGITGINPGFAVANFIKDQFTAFVFTDATMETLNPFNYVESIYSTFKKNALFRDMAKYGAGGTFLDTSRAAGRETIASIRSKKNLVSRVKYTITTPKEWLRTVENIVGKTEEITRAHQFNANRKMFLKQGRTLKDANILAGRAYRDTTVNFYRRGEWGTTMNSMFLYLNAGIQGGRTLARNFKTKPLKTSLKLVTSLYTPIATATMWNLSDPLRREAYEDMEEWEKKNNIIIVPPNPVKGADGKWISWKIPIPQGLNSLTVPVRRGIEQGYGLDPVSMQEIASSFLGSVSPVEATASSLGTFIPQIIKPTVESVSGYDFFREKYILSEKQQGLDPDLQVYKSTSGTAMKIASVLGSKGVSPVRVEHWLKKTFGGNASLGLHYSDQLLASLKAIPEAKIGGESVTESVMRRFTKVYGGKTERLEREAIADDDRKSKSDAKSLKNKAVEVYENMKKLNDKDREKAMSLIEKGTPDLFKKIEAEEKRDKKGLSYTEYKLNQLYVNDGTRAKRIYTTTKDLSDIERNKIFADYKKKGIISKNVGTQIMNLIKSNGKNFKSN